MKVLFLSNMDRFSGGEIVMERLILASSELEATVALPQGLFMDRCNANGITTIEVNEFQKLYIDENKFYIFNFVKIFFLSLYRILYILHHNEFDLVVINNDGIVPAAGVAAFLKRKKTVWICYNIYDRRFFKRIFNLSKFVTCITPVSYAVCESFLLAGVKQSKLVVIYSGLDIEYFNPIILINNYWRSRYKIPEYTVLIGIVGVITRWKGHRHLLEALSMLNKELNWHLLIIGDLIRDTTDDKLYLKEIENDIERYRLRDKITFTGRVNSISEIYSDLDIVINASVKPEPLGTTIYEGMAFEKVVIATEIGGSPEIISNNVDGFLVSPIDCRKFSETLFHCVDNIKTPQLDTLKSLSRQKVKKKFSVVVMSKKYSSLFLKLASE